jgi:hypothetical protein
MTIMILQRGSPAPEMKYFSLFYDPLVAVENCRARDVAGIRGSAIGFRHDERRADLASQQGF